MAGSMARILPVAGDRVMVAGLRMMVSSGRVRTARVETRTVRGLGSEEAIVKECVGRCAKRKERTKISSRPYYY